MELFKSRKVNVETISQSTACLALNLGTSSPHCLPVYLFTKDFAILSQILAIASQKLVLQIVLTYKSIQNNRDVFYDEMVLLFFMNTIAKPHVKRLIVTLHSQKMLRSLASLCNYIALLQ